MLKRIWIINPQARLSGMLFLNGRVLGLTGRATCAIGIAFARLEVKFSIVFLLWCRAEASILRLSESKHVRQSDGQSLQDIQLLIVVWQRARIAQLPTIIKAAGERHQFLSNPSPCSVPELIFRAREKRTPCLTYCHQMRSDGGNQKDVGLWCFAEPTKAVYF